MLGSRFQSIASGHISHLQQPAYCHSAAAMPPHPFSQRTNDLNPPSHSAAPPITPTHSDRAVPSRILASLSTLITLMEKQNARFENIDARLGQFEQRFEQFSANVEHRHNDQAEAAARQDIVLKNFAETALKLLGSDLQAAIQPDLQALRKECIDLRESSATLNIASKQFHHEHGMRLSFHQIHGKLLGLDDRLRDLQTASIRTETLMPLLQEALHQQQRLNATFESAVRQSYVPKDASSFLLAHQASLPEHWGPLSNHEGVARCYDHASQTSFIRPTPTSLPASQTSQTRLHYHVPYVRGSSPSGRPASARTSLLDSRAASLAASIEQTAFFDTVCGAMRDLPQVIAQSTKPGTAAANRARKATIRKQAIPQESFINFSAIEKMAEAGAGEPLSPANLAKFNLLGVQDQATHRSASPFAPPSSKIVSETCSVEFEPGHTHLQRLSQTSHLIDGSDYSFSSPPQPNSAAYFPLNPVRSPGAALRISNSARMADSKADSMALRDTSSGTRARSVASKHKKRIISQSDEDTSGNPQLANDTARPSKKPKTPNSVTASMVLLKGSPPGAFTTAAPQIDR